MAVLAWFILKNPQARYNRPTRLRAIPNTLSPHLISNPDINAETSLPHGRLPILNQRSVG